MSFFCSSGVSTGEPRAFHEAGHRAGELLEEVLDTARASAEVIEHHVAHDAPAQSRSPGKRVVHVGGAQHILGNEVIDLARQRALQTVRNVAWQFLVEAHAFFPIDV